MNYQKFLHNILSDLKVELADEFDRNFERKAFFDKAWEASNAPNRRGALMARTGDLRKSITATTDDDKISFSSSLAYASIHNNGGTLTVTTKMKKYFWAMYLKNAGTSEQRQGLPLPVEAQYYKALALKKVGSKITIKQRQFIGHHEQVDKSIRAVVDDNIQELSKEITASLKKR